MPNDQFWIINYSLAIYSYSNLLLVTLFSSL